MFRRTLCFFAVIAMLLPSACSKNVEESTLTATDLMPIEDVKTLVTYEPKMTTENIRRKSSVRYDSEPIGQDPVIVELYSYNSAQSIEDVHNEFTEKKEKYTKAIELDVDGGEGFIAFPSANIYRDGHMVVVTAGSGADDAQTELLKKAAAIAAAHLEEYLKNNPTNNDLLSE